MADRTVKLGFVVYIDIDGRPETGYQGDDVDVHEDDLERFDRLNVVADVVEVAAAAPTQTDIDEAVTAAVEAKEAELAAARQAIDAEVARVAAAKDELAREREAFEAEKAAASAQSDPEPEPEKKTPARKPAQS